MDTTPLHLATTEAEVQELIISGADIEAVNELGETPLFAANAEVTRALLAAGANSNAVNKAGNTPLSRAPTTEVAKMLIAAMRRCR